MSDGLSLPRAHADAIRAHGRETYPHECCGFLLGPAGGAAVTEIAQASNARTDSPSNRYLIPPTEFVRVQRDADRRGLEIVGFYHSHPDHPARPSAFDRDHAWPGYAYLIVEIQGGEALALNGYRLDAIGGEFHEIAIEEA